MEGLEVGNELGTKDGFEEGIVVGSNEGLSDGTDEGKPLLDGKSLGSFCAVGWNDIEGSCDWGKVGPILGIVLGSSVRGTEGFSKGS